MGNPNEWYCACERALSGNKCDWCKEAIYQLWNLSKEIWMVIIMIKQVKKILTATIECPTCGRKTSDRPERCCNCGNKL